MATSCRVMQFRVEEEVLQPIEKWVEEQEERCRNEECNWWMLCLNRLVCWFVTILVKVTMWVVTVIIRWVYRVVCVVVMLIVGILLLVTLNADVLLQALSDAWDLLKDLFFEAVGILIFVGISVIDFTQTAIKVQPEKRRLTRAEQAALRPIFGNSLLYTAIRVADGPAGLLTGWSGRPYTIGYTIYATSPSITTIVHECVHVWQFQFGGAHYIGQSTVYQGLEMVGLMSPIYDWESTIGTGPDAWFLLDSIEAQASFITDVFTEGRFVHDDGTTDPPPGAFFQRDTDGQNVFDHSSGPAPIDRTIEANGAWEYIFMP